MIDTDTDPALIGGQIVNTVRRGFAKLLVHEIMHAYLDRIPFLLPFLPGILKVADQFLLFGIDTDDRLTGLDRGLRALVQMMKLRIPIRVLSSFPRLADALQTVSFRCQQIAHGALPHRMFRPCQLCGQLRCALAGPPQLRLRIAPRDRIHQPVQGIPQSRIFLCQSFTATAGPP